ncbi:hypothetical protein CBR_g54876 [Chara braunii]|uniref:nicotinate phosphoribosyltransferase n=1 Tax=Chara braunii TaxID=69332 RepID=A0A388JPR9_CHABU|nr:hypothetical protein CBR_g54876 [Chara braunii]|eukprot:GBG59773.1 hypothetical protein CBR_g54876 [Chara braunii]
MHTLRRSRMDNLEFVGRLQSFSAIHETFSQCSKEIVEVFRSGVPNFCAVALSLIDCGYKPLGIRLDSGDLAYQSIEARKFFGIIGEAFCLPTFQKMTITASNDITEDTLDALNKQGHSIDAYGIGTHLVTCFKQPALGCVYKLVEINGQPRIKISADPTKVTIPGKKWGYRIYGKEGYALLDLLMAETDCPPKIGQRILCRHPFSEAKRAYVVPQRVEPLYKTYWSGKAEAKKRQVEEEMREWTQEQKEKMAAIQVKVEKEEEEEPLERRRGEASTSKEEQIEKLTQEWTAHLELGEDREAEVAIPQAEREPARRELGAERDPARRKAKEGEQQRAWKWRMSQEKVRRLEAAERAERDLKAAETRMGKIRERLR